jgi:hypothetical protein
MSDKVYIDEPPRRGQGRGSSADRDRGGSNPRQAFRKSPNLPPPFSVTSAANSSSQPSSPFQKGQRWGESGRNSATGGSRFGGGGSKPTSPCPKSPAPASGIRAASNASEWTVCDGSAADAKDGASQLRSPVQPSTPNISMPGSPSLVGEGADHKPILAERFKTKMCRNFVETGECPYEIRCMFAHGDDEMRSKTMNLADGLVTEDAIKNFQRAAAERHRKASKKSQKRGRGTGAGGGGGGILHSGSGPVVPLSESESGGAFTSPARGSRNASPAEGLRGSTGNHRGGPHMSPPQPRNKQLLSQRERFEQEKRDVGGESPSPRAATTLPSATLSKPRSAGQSGAQSERDNSTSLPRQISDSGNNDPLLEATWNTDSGSSNNGVVAETAVRQASSYGSEGATTNPFAPAATGATAGSAFGQVAGTNTAAGGSGWGHYSSSGSGPSVSAGGAKITSNAFEAFNGGIDGGAATGTALQGPRFGASREHPPSDDAITPPTRPTPASSAVSNIFTPGMALLNLGPSSTNTVANSSATTTARNASDDDDGEELMGLISALRGTSHPPAADTG